MTRTHLNSTPWNRRDPLGGLVALALATCLCLTGCGEDGAAGEAVSDAVDPSRERVQATYPKGASYESRITIEARGQGTNQQWTWETVKDMHYLGELIVTRTIEHNDGRQVRMIVQFEQVRSMVVRAELASVQVRVPPLVQWSVDAAGCLAMEGTLYPGWSELTIQAANEVLRNEFVIKMLNDLQDHNELDEIRIFADELEGHAAQITYDFATGERNVQLLGALEGDLRERAEAAFQAIGLVSDVYILPHFDSAPGDVWRVEAAKFLPVIDPSTDLEAYGVLSLRRGDDVQDGAARVARLSVDRGTLQFRRRDQGADTQARWTPRGEIHVSYDQGIVTRAELDGTIELVDRSVDHFLFESRFTAQPQYRVLYEARRTDR